MTARLARGLAVCVAGLAVAGCVPEPERNLVLISLDTLRADHLNAYGYAARTTSPAIDTLAAEGARFVWAFANSPWTTPSHMSLFTSLYPSAHGMDHPMGALKAEPRSLSDAIRTLPEILRDAGFETAAFTGGGTVSGRYGFARGFDVYQENPPRSARHRPSLSERVAAFLASRSDRRFFLFLHTFAIHSPYVHESDGSKRKWDLADNIAYSRDLQGSDDAARERIRARYDGGIRAADRMVGEIVEQLRAAGLFERTIVVVLSDHGESLFEHVPDSEPPMTTGHGWQLYDEVLRVPLIVAAPGLVRAGQTVDTPVELIDVLPTLLALLDVEDSGIGQGRNLSPALTGRGDLEPRPVFASATAYGPERRAVRTVDAKYVWIADRSPSPLRDFPGQRHWDWTGLPERELFDLRVDPDEGDDLAARRPEQVERLAKLLELQSLRDQRLRARLEPGRAEVDADQLEALRVLGYVD